MSDFVGGAMAIIVTIAMVLAVIFGGVWIWSMLRVMNATSIGKAELAQAEQLSLIHI